MGKSFSRHVRRKETIEGRSRCTLARESQSPIGVRTAAVNVVDVVKIDESAGDGILRCRIVVDGEYVDRLVRTDIGGSECPSSPSVELDIPIKVILTPASSHDASQLKPLGCAENQLHLWSAGDVKERPPPPYRPYVGDDNPSSADTADRLCSVVLDDGSGNRIDFINDEVESLLQQLSQALSNSSILSPLGGRERTVRLRLVDSSTSPTNTASSPVSEKLTDAPVAAGLETETVVVGRKERTGFRLRSVNRDDTPASSAQPFDLVDVEATSSPWELLPTAAPTGQSAEQRVGVTRPIACCVARGRILCDEINACGSKGGVDVEDRQLKADFDERQLAELLRQNLDLNVQANRLRSRRCVSAGLSNRPRSCYVDNRLDCRNSCRRIEDSAVDNIGDKSPTNPSHRPKSSPLHRVNRPVLSMNLDERCANGPCEGFRTPVSGNCAVNEDVVGGPAATSSPKCNRNKTHRCSAANRVRHVIGSEDIDAGDSPRKRKSGTRKEMETVSTSHYYRRHRHRARNQSRAMRQVAEWIERAEPSRNVGDDGEGDLGEHLNAKHGNSCRHEHYHYHYHYCVDGNAWGIC